MLRLGSPSTIHSATIFPAPPPAAIPNALNPTATKQFASSGAGPSMQFPSGVKASGPLTRRAIPAVPRQGVRFTAAWDMDSKWSKSGSRSSWVNPLGIPRMDQGMPSRS